MTHDSSWLSPRRDLPLPLFLLAMAVTGVALAVVLMLAQDAVCAIHEGQHPICPGYTTTDTEEPRP